MKTYKLRSGFAVAVLLLAVVVSGKMCAAPTDAQTPTVAENFVNSVTDEQLETIIKQTDFFTNAVGFDSVSELEIGAVFNLYASTEEMQRQINAIGSDETVAIPLSEFTAFVREYFGDYAFTVEQLYEQIGGRIELDTDNNGDAVILLNPINGGVMWPSAVDNTIEIDSVTVDGDLVTVSAVRHYFDNAEIDSWLYQTLVIKPLESGYNYVSLQTDVEPAQ